MRPVTNYPDTMPKASGCLCHVTKNDRKQNDDRLSFHKPLSLEMCISVATVVSDRRAALSEARHSLGISKAWPFPIMAASATLFSLRAVLLLLHLTCCHEKTKTPLWLSSTQSWFSDPLLKWWEGSAARSVVGCFLLISFDHRANHSQFI